MEIALCYIYTIVPVPYRYSTGSRGSVPVSAVRISNPSSTCSTRPSTGTVRTGRNPGEREDVISLLAAHESPRSNGSALQLLRQGKYAPTLHCTLLVGIHKPISDNDAMDLFDKPEVV